LPQTETPIEELKLSFVYRNADVTANNGILTLGVMKDVTDPLTFTPLQSYAKTASLTSVVHYFKNDAATLLEDATNIAFRYSGTSNNYYLSIDDVRLNCHSGPVVQRDTICRNTPYNKNGFVVAANQLHDGTNTFDMEITSPLGCDYTNRLELYVVPQLLTEFSDAVCSETPYTSNGFNLLAPVSGDYRLDLYIPQGCDSTVIMHLTVIPKNVELTATICEGTSYSFGAQTPTTSGTYVQNLHNRLGCDSIVTLHLTVKERAVTRITGYTCNGAAYNDNGFLGITTAGEHTLRLTGSNGCDSLVILTLINSTTVYGSKRDTICRGDVYSFAGNSYTSTGEYTGRFTAVSGCDSLVTLQLAVMPVYQRNDEFSLSRSQLPYDYHGFIIAATEPEGSHTYNVTLPTRYGCDSIFTLVTYISGPVGLLEASTTLLGMYPNPVKRGETVQIAYEFNDVERQDLLLEVFNTMGQRVYMERPVVYPLAIKQFPTSGVYLVRISTGNDIRLYGRIVVE
jgi:hypothetical protein